jgi:lipopolysaccharide transport system ATP-binding protein
MEQTHSITFKNVTKLYHIGRSTSLRQAVGDTWKRALGKNETETKTLAALDDVSFSITPGSSVGIIGPNGSGKTTALKLMSKVTRATCGEIQTYGRISALIELGAGFHPDLSGRENIYLNAAILGMNRAEVEARFDQIVDFSGLESFLETPVKRYSSGMYCRLGFAVAAHVNPDILLVDEVLAVGDAAFQTRCFRRMGELRKKETTIIFVTHSLGYLQRLCTRGIFLYQGKVMIDDNVDQVIQAYRDHESFRGTNKLLDGSPILLDEEVSPYLVRIIDVFFTVGGEKVSEVKTGQACDIVITYHADQKVTDVNFEIWIKGMDMTEYTSFASAWDCVQEVSIIGDGEVSLHIPCMGLMPGTYFINVAISDRKGLYKYDRHDNKHQITVLSGPTAYGLVFLDHRWRLAK